MNGRLELTLPELPAVPALPSIPSLDELDQLIQVRFDLIQLLPLVCAVRLAAGAQQVTLQGWELILASALAGLLVLVLLARQLVV